MFKKYKIHIKSFFVFLLYFSFFPLMASLLKTININISDYKSIILITLDILIFIIFFYIYKTEIINYFKNFKKTFKNDYEIYFRYWIIGLIISTFISFLIMFFIKPGLPSNEETIRNLLLTLPIYSIISTTIIAPFIEELAFRKIFYDVLKNRKYFFIIISGIVFGLAHIGFSTNLEDLIDAIPYSILGSTFALMYYKSKNIMYPMFFHFLHNTLLIISFYMSYLFGGK